MSQTDLLEKLERARGVAAVERHLERHLVGPQLLDDLAERVADDPQPLEHGGALGRADEAELVDWAVRNHAGLLVEALATAGADMKRFVRQTWSYFLQGCRERRPETSTEADLLMARARLRASAEATFIARWMLLVSTSVPS